MRLLLVIHDLPFLGFDTSSDDNDCHVHRLLNSSGDNIWDKILEKGEYKQTFVFRVLKSSSMSWKLSSFLSSMQIISGTKYGR